MANSHPNVSNLKPAQKGEVRNPNGAPKYKSAKDTLRELLIETHTVKVNGKEQISTAGEFISRTLIMKAMRGDARSAGIIYDRTDGKPTQINIVTSSNEEKLMQLSPEALSEVYKDLKILQREHGILDTVEIEVFEELENKYNALEVRYNDLLQRHEALAQ